MDLFIFFVRKVFSFNIILKKKVIIPFFLGKKLIFIILRDGTGYLQSVFAGDLCKKATALSLSTESSICVYGTLELPPPSKTVPGGIELIADYWELVKKFFYSFF